MEARLKQSLHLNLEHWVNSRSCYIPSQPTGLVFRKNAGQQQHLVCCMNFTHENGCGQCRCPKNHLGGPGLLPFLDVIPPELEFLSYVSCYFQARRNFWVFGLFYFYLSLPVVNLLLILTGILACQWDPKLKHQGDESHLCLDQERNCGIPGLKK